MLTLDVNGKQLTTDAAEDTPLLWVLRDNLNLTGTKFGCGMALCGSCTVHVDGQPTRSCTLPIGTAKNHKITTIEGMANADGSLGVIQQAFQDYHGLQCGFCTPGMVMSAIELVQLHPDADAREIREQLAGNLCRCTGYQNIVKSVQQAARVMALPTPRTKVLEGGGDVRH